MEEIAKITRMGHPVTRSGINLFEKLGCQCKRYSSVEVRNVKLWFGAKCDKLSHFLGVERTKIRGLWPGESWCESADWKLIERWPNVKWFWLLVLIYSLCNNYYQEREQEREHSIKGCEKRVGFRSMELLESNTYSTPSGLVRAGKSFIYCYSRVWWGWRAWERGWACCCPHIIHSEVDSMREKAETGNQAFRSRWFPSNFLISED